uniref:Uncharacterized protein n=1 Tax=Cacopsylla melanoneura TaxID=428564 RepID=A0A8D8Y4K4_9HEMI
MLPKWATCSVSSLSSFSSRLLTFFSLTFLTTVRLPLSTSSSRALFSPSPRLRCSVFCSSCFSVSSVVLVVTIGPLSSTTLPSSSTTCRLTRVCIWRVVVSSVFFLVMISSSLEVGITSSTGMTRLLGGVTV